MWLILCTTSSPSELNCFPEINHSNPSSTELLVQGVCVCLCAHCLKLIAACCVAAPWCKPCTLAGWSDEDIKFCTGDWRRFGLWERDAFVSLHFVISSTIEKREVEEREVQEEALLRLSLIYSRWSFSDPGRADQSKKPECRALEYFMTRKYCHKSAPFVFWKCAHFTYNLSWHLLLKPDDHKLFYTSPPWRH